MRLHTVRLGAPLALALLLAMLAAAAPQAGKVPCIGILGQAASDPAEARVWQSFRLALREHGWREGENLRIESRWAEGDATRVPALTAELVRLPVDLIVTRGSIFVEGAKQAAASLPIVFLSHADPVGLGHVASLARPGGHITGLSSVHTDLAPKRLEFLRAAVPEATRIAVLWTPEAPSHPTELTILEKAARTLQVQLQLVEVRGEAELEDAFAAMARERVGGVLVLGAVFTYVHRAHLAALALQHRLPSMFNWWEGAEAGGLMSYGPDIMDLTRRAVIFYIDKILKGAKPADLPVEQASTYALVINLKTAQALGLTLPPTVLFQAAELLR
jgi:putative tryptophan/tyrosine transport system substrate-binding protein